MERLTTKNVLKEFNGHPFLKKAYFFKPLGLKKGSLTKLQKLYLYIVEKTKKTRYYITFKTFGVSENVAKNNKLPKNYKNLGI
ncbi:MAG: hypothetical protein LBF22_02200 [Deltaproteobacteria bacterium]|nr:hypothetical protein [Deltaproteobacteria bacterium]